MSEKLYVLLLRLYPARFRNEYRDDALQLLRDRLRDERGFFLRLQLFVDILADLFVSVPSAYLHDQPALVAALAKHRSVDTPVFYVLPRKAPLARGLVLGGILSLAGFGLVAVSIAQPTKHRSPALFSGGYKSRQVQAAQPVLQDARGATDGSTKLDSAERKRVIDGVTLILKEHYIHPDIAQKTAEVLVAHEHAGDYDAITDGAPFADILTAQLRELSHDLHLEVVYFRRPSPSGPQVPTPEETARFRATMEQQNCAIEKVQILPHNVGYLKLNFFPVVSICEPKARSAMVSLNNASAIVFDLRDNRGGFPDMVMLIASYLFDHPEYMYNPRENTTEQSWTHSPVPGNILAHTPVYILTSSRTFSGAEHFSYDLKMLKRATLVGETTGGATDTGAFYGIDDHFGIGLTEARAINPYSEPDWTVTGVTPDVKVKSADALEIAEKLIEEKLRKK